MKLVSCVMPTSGRPGFARAALDCWSRQLWPRLELVILDDERNPSFPGGLHLDGVRYYAISERITLGAKRNLACQFSEGEVICHFDDDDWSAPERISSQMAILESTRKPVTGFGTLLFWDVTRAEAKIYRAVEKDYVCGTSLMFLRSYWERYPFEDRQKSSDNTFVRPAIRRKEVAQSQEMSLMVARIHDCHHTSPKTAVNKKIAKEIFPAGFWENEKLRCGGF